MSREELRSAAASEVDRHEQAFVDELMRLFDRQERVVLARLSGTKARKHTRHWEPAGDRPLEVKGIIDAARWLGESKAVMGPLVRRVFGGVYGRVSKGLAGDEAEPADDDQVEEAVQARLDRIAEGVDTAREEVEALIKREEDAGTPMDGIVSQVRDLYADRKPSWAARIATLAAVGTINQAGLMAAAANGSSAKQWLSRRDSRVRETHEHADGQVRLLDERFRLGGPKTKNPRSLLMFPGDPAPTVPINEVINCRCTLLFSPPRRQAKDADLDLEEKARSSGPRRVRTAGGAQQYGQAIGSVIRRDIIGNVAGMDLELAGSDPAVRAIIAKQKPGLNLRGTSAAVLRDHKDRVSAYVVWDRSSGDVLEVSVHPSLRGQRIGDQMVAAVVAHDPTVKPRARRTAAPAPAAAPAPVSTPVPAAAPRGPKPITDRTRAGDTPGTSGDFDADEKRINRLQKAYLADRVDTTSLHSRGGRWSRDRQRQQQEIIDHFLNQPGVKSDRKLLVLGGLPGSGKTTTINSAAGQAALGLDLSEYVVVNADEVKSEMIARGMVPDYPGLTADEAATLYHAESFEVAHSLMRQAAKAGKNFAYDTSLKSTGQAGFATGAGSRSAPPPYETTMLFVDVPIDVAKQRAKDRYLAGGRYMPLALIDGMRARTNSHKSGPSYNFDQVKGSADRWAVFDNTGAAPVLKGQGGRKARAPRTAAAAPAAAPTPAAVPAAAPAAPAVPDARAARRAAADAAEAKLSDTQLLAEAQANWNEALQDGYMVGDVAGTVKWREEDVLRDLRAGEQSIMVKDDVEQYLTRRQALAALRANGVDTSEFDAPAPAPAPTRAAAAPASASSAIPNPPAGSAVYQHPSGKVVHVLPDGSLQAFKADGTPTRTSADAQKLAGGYGSWKQVAGPAPVAPSSNRARPQNVPSNVAPATQNVAPATQNVAVPAALPPVPAGARVFVHPQGKHIYLLPDGSMQVYKPDGKKATSSATPQKLLAGYGGWSELGANTGTPMAATPAPSTAADAPPLVAAPKAPLDVSAGAPAPSGSLPVAPMDFGEAPLTDVPRYIADPDYVFQQKVDGIRGVLVIEPGKQPWFASKKGDRLVSSTAAQVTTPLLAKLPPTPAGSPAYRVEGEILNGKFHVFDMVVVGQEQTPYEDRKVMADTWVAAVGGSLPQVQALPTARTAAEKQALWDKVLASGAEGVMMKRRDSPYSGGQRVNHTLKAKITATADVIVLERNRGGKDNAVFGMIGPNGQVVEIGTVSTGGKDKALGQIQVGEVVEVEYLWASYGSNTLTQPRIIRKRKDKTANDATRVDQLRFVDKTVLALQAKALRMQLEHAVERMRA